MLFADEPTGNLDRQTGTLADLLIFRQPRARHHALILVTRPGAGGALRPAAAGPGQRSVTGGGMIARWFWREWRSPSPDYCLAGVGVWRHWPAYWRSAVSSDGWKKRLKSAKPRVYGRRSDAAKFAGGTQRHGEEARKRGLNVGEERLAFATMTFYRRYAATGQREGR